MTTQTCLLRSALTVSASIVFVLAWSSGFIAAKVATVDVSMWTLLLWRYLLLSAALLVACVATGALRGLRVSQLRRQAVVGAFSQLGYVVFVYASVAAGISTGTTALIDAVQPLVVATLVGPVLGLRVRGASWAGLALGVAGVALVVGSQLESSAAPGAYALPVFAMLCLIAATFIDRRHPNDLPILATLTIHVVVVVAALAIVALATGNAEPPAGVGFWAVTAFTAAVPSLLAYGLYWWLIRRIGVTKLNALLFAVAPTTAVAGAAAFGELFSALTVLGFVVCAVAVTLVLVAESRGDEPAHDAVASDPFARRSPMPAWTRGGGERARAPRR
jgi:drug/metabolite transporter (DMT)-like permease